MRLVSVVLNLNGCGQAYNTYTQPLYNLRTIPCAESFLCNSGIMLTIIPDFFKDFDKRLTVFFRQAPGPF